MIINDVNQWLQIAAANAQRTAARMILSIARTTSSILFTDRVGCTINIRLVSPNSFATGSLF